jgi:drug/metabolite transporter (DMT)-like permease
MIAHRGSWSALLAAALFGASTPVAKVLLGTVSPVMLAGLFYAGSGAGLGVVLLVRRWKSDQTLALPAPGDLRWLAGAILFGGIVAPILLLAGLRVTDAAPAALLLNLEGAFTALLAWFAFREHFDRRIALGMGLILGGGLLLSWQPGAASFSEGALLVIAACLCWAVDNNLTRKVAAGDATLIACIKGAVAGAVNLALAGALGDRFPAAGVALSAAAVGLLSYGVSLTLFVVALRELGTARTGAYFSVAPFFGAMLALTFGQEPLTTTFLFAAVLMAIGVWLHVSERHVHWHVHDAQRHAHAHVHDEHHRHPHAGGWDGVEPHEHAHEHLPLKHVHAHFPDVHHRHEH